MGKHAKRSISVLLTAVMILTSFVIAMPVASAGALTTATSGVKAEFVTTSGGSATVDGITLASSGGFATTVYLKLTNTNTDLPVTIQSVVCNNSYGRIAGSSSSTYTPNQTLQANGTASYQLTATTSLAASAALSYTITYTVNGLLNADGTPVTATQVAYIYAEKLNPVSAEFESYDAPRFQREVDAKVVFTATTGYLTRTALVDNRTEYPTMTASYYIDRDKASTYEAAGWQMAVTRQYSNNYTVQTASVTQGGAYDAIGSFGFESNSLVTDTSTTKKNINLRVENNNTQYQSLYGSIPVGSTSSASPATLSLVDIDIYCTTVVMNSSYGTANFNIYSYSKNGLRAEVLAAEAAGYNSAYYTTATWNAYTAALQTARQVLGTTMTNNKEVNDALTALKNARNNLAQGSRVVTVTDHVYNGDQSVAPQTSVRYYLVATSNSFTAPYISAGSANRKSAPATFAASTASQAQSIDYWIIDDTSLAAAIAEIDGMDLSPYTQESAKALTDTVNSYRAYLVADGAAPFYQSKSASAESIEGAVEAIQAAKDALVLTTYTVKFYDDETKGEFESLAITDIIPGSKIEAPDAPAKEFKEFDGWFTEDGTKFAFEETAITGDLALYAKYSDAAAEWDAYDAAVSAWNALNAIDYKNYDEVAASISDALAYGNDRDGITAAQQATIDGYKQQILTAIEALEAAEYILSAEWVEGYAVQKQESFYVVTTAGNVSGLKFTNGSISYTTVVRHMETKADGTKVWTMSIPLNTIGTRDYVIVPVVGTEALSKYSMVIETTVVADGSIGAADYSGISAAEPEDLSIYTKESVNEMKAAKAAINMRLSKLQQDLVDEMIGAYKAAVDALELKPATTTKLTTAVTRSAAALESDNYEADTAAEALAALVEEAEQGIADGYTILEQDAVNALVTELYDAIRSLALSPEGLVTEFSYDAEVNINTASVVTATLSDITDSKSLAVVNESGQKIGAALIKGETATVSFSAATRNENRNLKLYVLNVNATTAVAVHQAIADGNVVAVYDMYITFS